jgi:hypothetical protein
MKKLVILRCGCALNVALSVLLIGCTGRDFQLAEVRGRIVEVGKPKPGLSIVFQPISSAANEPNPGPGSYGTTDENGEYRLRTFDSDQLGAVVGKHRVAIHVRKPGVQRDSDRTDPDAAIPRRFRDGSLTMEVPVNGLSSADFDLAVSQSEQQQ